MLQYTSARHERGLKAGTAAMINCTPVYGMSKGAHALAMPHPWHFQVTLSTSSLLLMLPIIDG